MCLKSFAKQCTDKFTHWDILCFSGGKRRDRPLKFGGENTPGGDLPPGGFPLGGWFGFSIHRFFLSS